MGKIVKFPFWLALGLLLVSVGSCVSPGLSRDVGVDPARVAEIRHLACRLDARYCGSLRVVLIRSRGPRAELRRDGTLLVSAGMLERVPDTSALAFVVAHELAHARLDHFTIELPERDIDMEISADAFAENTVAQAGFDRGAGLRFLETLRREAAAPRGGSESDLAALDQRIAALRLLAAKRVR